MEYQLNEKVAILHFDDGKANAVGHSFIDAMLDGLDRAASEAGAVVIMGRDARFSAGFDLSEFQKGPEATMQLAGRGAQMMSTLFKHPQPVVAACTGHAIAAGALLLLAADTRLGVPGEFRIGLNETAIGMSLPVFATQLANARLSRRHLTAAFIQSQLYNPEEALDAGYLDELTPPDQLLERAIAIAAQLGEFSSEAYATNKLAIRGPYIDAIEASLS
ncbi:MAG: crotonase/enoyl-CoA hydratase family protein [Pseudomonadales bacterium]|nr:crotonase/enoyl-CoA hydratase family protein [Pseudomonadales bacterium]MDP6473187.1 crotonase/enoyl-CoA hydratase family protein [Pseudomonadales bacterium]MDP6826053.1 crotonase/enoyl-CoA hydratase family protein [Pseudomonadales bacterium]